MDLNQLRVVQNDLKISWN